jgi:2-dehydropantoate 2-reductase
MHGKPRILIVGCGGIGGVIATLMAQGDTASVHVLSTNIHIANAVRTNGIQLSGVGGNVSATVKAHTEPPDERFDFVLLATQPPQVESAARSVLSTMTDNSRMVVLQNGLCESRVAKICGADRVVGGIVTFGASTNGPGEIERTSSGGILLGRIDGKPHPQVDILASALAPIGPIEQTSNLMGARFSKLALNCAVSGLGTVAGVRLGTLLGWAKARNVALGVMAEAVAVSQAEAIQLEAVGGTFDLNWLANPDASGSGPSHWSRHAMLMAVGFKYRKLRSSMLRAIEHGREPAVDFLNGEIVTRGEAHGLMTPINRSIVELVHQIAQGRIQPSPTHLDGLALHLEPKS